MTGLDQTLSTIATVPVLLVASDFDGTIASIVRDPVKARPRRESIAALRTLCALPRTHVAVISGRAREELARLSGLPADVYLVGSHGSELDADFAESMPPEAVRLRDRLLKELTAVAAEGAGFAIETKPAGVALHYRNAAATEAEQAVRAVLSGPGSIQGVYTRQGKKVIELGVVATSKGEALERIRRLCGASAVIYFGDDTTDEDAFATLTGPDVGVKVGRGRTRAAHRVGGPRQVEQALTRLSELRAAWLAGAEPVPLE